MGNMRLHKRRQLIVDIKLNMNNDEFRDIAPFDNDMFKSKLEELLKEPGFEHAVRYVMPGVDFNAFAGRLQQIDTKEDFQTKIMLPFLEWLEANTTDGVSISGLDNYDAGTSYTFITNHRDIVLDASFLNLNFLHAGRPTTEIAIGDNLLIYNWIDDLVRLNKSFIVRRNLKLTQALESARHLSAYIHHCILYKHESVWIAQREGRAKDSNDLTQESLIKMMGLSGGGTMRSNIEDVNLLPTAISYEYDPNDYLKVKEFLLRHRDPQFKKSQHDDLLSMETGLLKHKGRIHFTLGKCITPALRELPSTIDKNEFVRAACDMIDREIHQGYMIYPINYIAYDTLTGTNRFADRYTSEDRAAVQAYAEGQLAKVDVPDLSSDEVKFMKDKLLSMYANPLLNKLKAEGESAV